MPIILTCGHEAKNTYEEHTIICKDYDRKGRRAISYRSVCLKCKLDYVNDGSLFESEDDAIAWMFEEI